MPPALVGGSIGTLMVECMARRDASNLLRGSIGVNDVCIQAGRRRFDGRWWLGPRLLWGLLRRWRHRLVRELDASASWWDWLCPCTNAQEEQTAKVKHRVRLRDNGTLVRQVRFCDKNCYGPMIFCVSGHVLLSCREEG